MSNNHIVDTIDEFNEQDYENKFQPRSIWRVILSRRHYSLEI